MRTITGTLKDAQGNLLTSQEIVFTPSGFLGSGGVLILPQPETTSTNGSGVYSIDLNTGIRYRCSIGPAVFEFDLEAGASTSLDALI